MSNRVRLLLIGLAVVIIAVLAWFFLLSPLRDDLASVDSQIQDEQTRLSQAQVRLAQAESTREEGRRNQARLLELAKLMPASEEVPSLLIQIQDLADQSGIEFVAITPGEAEQSETAGFKVLPLDLEFSGTFFDVSDFIWRAEQMVAGPGRLLAVKDLQMQLADAEGAAGGVSPELSVTMTMYAFVVGQLTPPAAPAQPATGTGSNATTSTTGQ